MLAAVCLPGNGQSVPKLINYQGKLTDTAGSPLPSGAYGIKIQIWSSATVGQLVWGQEYSNVAVVNGVFNIILGAGGTTVSGAAAKDRGLAFNESDRFIGLIVTKGATGLAIANASEIVPRQQILSTPYALRAQVAETTMSSLVPTGIISMWSGSIAKIPAGWALCDGSNGTPDLRDRFIVDRACPKS